MRASFEWDLDQHCCQQELANQCPSLKIGSDSVSYTWGEHTRVMQVSNALSMQHAVRDMNLYGDAMGKLHASFTNCNRHASQN